LPILHNRMEFAVEVRRQFEEYKPQHIAVEYPATLKDKILQGVERLPFLSVVYYEDKDDTFTYLLLEPTDGQVEAIRLALSENLTLHFVDRDTSRYPLDFSPLPDPYAVKRIGHFAFTQAYLNAHPTGLSSPEDTLREKTMAYHLQQLSRTGRRILFVGGLAHLPGLLNELNQLQTQVIGRRKRQGVGLAHLHRESSREVMSEMPYLATSYERARSEGNPEKLDRLQINSQLVKAAVKNHWKNNKEELSYSQIRILNKFARNYALLTGFLVPDFYQLIVAARGAADDNFAYEMWEKGSEYPWQTEEPGLPILRLKGEDLFLDQKRIKFHRRLKTMRRRLVPVPVKRKKRERYYYDISRSSKFFKSRFFSR